MSSTVPDPTSTAQLKEALLAFWGARAEREKWALAGAGAVLGLAMIWWIAVAPALKTLRQAPQTEMALDAQLEQMRLLAVEADRLRQQPAISPNQAETALRAATARLGDQVQLNLQGDRATVTLNNVPGWALSTWLSEVRESAHARPEKAELNKVSETSYSGSVSLLLSRPSSD